MPEISYHELSEKRMAHVVDQTAAAITAKIECRKKETPLKKTIPHRFDCSQSDLTVPRLSSVGPVETISKIRNPAPKIHRVKEPAFPADVLEKCHVDACNALAVYRDALAAANQIATFDVHNLWHQLNKLKP